MFCKMAFYRTRSHKDFWQASLPSKRSIWRQYFLRKAFLILFSFANTPKRRNFAPTLKHLFNVVEEFGCLQPQ